MVLTVGLHPLKMTRHGGSVVAAEELGGATVGIGIPRRDVLLLHTKLHHFGPKIFLDACPGFERAPVDPSVVIVVVRRGEPALVAGDGESHDARGVRGRWYHCCRLDQLVECWERKDSHA
jgi:hypothetical protein